MQDHIEATMLLGYVFGTLHQLKREGDGYSMEESLNALVDELTSKINRIYYSSKD